jgi:hypothetical protein
MDAQWWSIEVRDGAFPASRWREAHSRFLLEAAFTNGAQDVDWSEQPWGLVLEIAFPDSEFWARFRALPAVTAALDAVPDPVNGLYVYPGKGGSSGATMRRRPRPVRGAGAATLPRPADPIFGQAGLYDPSGSAASHASGLGTVELPA